MKKEGQGMTKKVEKLKIVCPNCQRILLYGNPIHLDTDERVLLKDQSRVPITGINLSIDCFKCGLSVVFTILNKLQPTHIGDSQEEHFTIL